MTDSQRNLHAADEDLQPLDNTAADLMGGAPTKDGGGAGAKAAEAKAAGKARVADSRERVKRALE